MHECQIVIVVVKNQSSSIVIITISINVIVINNIIITHRITHRMRPPQRDWLRSGVNR